MINPWGCSFIKHPTRQAPKKHPTATSQGSPPEASRPITLQVQRLSKGQLSWVWSRWVDRTCLTFFLCLVALFWVRLFCFSSVGLVVSSSCLFLVWAAFFVVSSFLGQLKPLCRFLGFLLSRNVELPKCARLHRVFRPAPWAPGFQLTEAAQSLRKMCQGCPSPAIQRKNDATVMKGVFLWHPGRLFSNIF